MNGFRVTGSYQGEDYDVSLPAAAYYSVHIEYEYLGKFGDCVDLNTLEDTLYVYPEKSADGESDFAVTKMALATEELYQFYRHKEG